MTLPLADVMGIPSYYMDTAVSEHIGDGNVRVLNCVTRNGILVPVCEIIIHSTRLIIAARTVGETAQMAFNHEMLLMASGLVAH